MNSESPSVEGGEQTENEQDTTTMKPIDVINKSNIRISVVDISGDPTVTVGSPPEVDEIPTDEEEQVVRDAYGEMATKLYEIAQSYSGNELAYKIGDGVNTCIEHTEFNSVSDFTDSIVVEDITEEELVSYTAFADVYDEDTYPDDVSPFVVATISDTYLGNRSVRTIVDRVRDHPHQVEFGTVQVFKGLDASVLHRNTSNLENIVAQLQKEGVDDVTTAVEHIYLFMNQDPPDERTISTAIEQSEEQLNGELRIPDETGKTPTVDETQRSENETSGGGSDDTPDSIDWGLSQNSTETASSNDEQGVDDTTEIGALEEITEALNAASDDSHSSLDEAWTVGSILEEGHEKYDVSYEDMVDAADISYSKPWQLGARNLYQFFDFKEYPDTLSVTGVQRVAPGFETNELARERLMNCADIDRKLTQQVASAWRDITGEFTVRNTVAIVETQDIPYPIKTVQLLCRLEGSSAPTEERITALASSIGDEDVALDTMLRDEVKRIQETQSGCDEAWEIGELIDEFTTVHDYNYSEIRDEGELPRSAEQMARAVHDVYGYREYPSNWSKSSIYHASRIYDDTETVREVLDRCEEELDGDLPSTVARIATDIERVAFPDVVNVLEEHDVTDIEHGIRVLCCLHNQEIPCIDDMPTGEESNRYVPKEYNGDAQRDGEEKITTDEDDTKSVNGDGEWDEDGSTESNRDNGTDGIEVPSSRAVESGDGSDVSDVLLPDGEITDVLQQCGDVTIDTERSVVTAPPGVTENLTETVSTGLPSKSVITVLEEIGEVGILATDTGYWAELVTGTGVDVTTDALNPSPEHFTLNYSDDSIDDGTIRDVKAFTDNPLFIPYPDYDNDIVATATTIYAVAGGETVLLLGELPDGTNEKRQKFMTDLTTDFMYVTTIETVQWQHQSDGLHVFTKTGELPKQLQED